MSIYASKEETELAVRPATPDEQWLKDQVARISPDYDSQDAYMGYVNALEDLALELRDANQKLEGEAGVLRALLGEARSVLDVVINDNDMEPEDILLLVDLSDKIKAALSPVPVVHFLAADDTEGGNL